MTGTVIGGGPATGAADDADGPETRAAAPPSFEVVAATGGYDAHATALLLDAASGLRLTSTEAAEWLAVGITPWAVPAWKKQGFADGPEAAAYRDGGLGPEDAYWVRVDSRSRSAAGSRAAQVEVPAPA